MPLIKLTCPKCGANIQLDDNNLRGYCSYCGVEVLLQESIAHKVIIDESDKVKSWVELGMIELKKNNYESAEEYANKVIESEIKNPEAWYIKGVTAASNKNFEAARSSLNMAKKYAMETDNNTGIAYVIQYAMDGIDKSSIIPKRKLNVSVDYNSRLIKKNLQVYVDDKKVLDLGCNEQSNVDLTKGNHTLKIKMGASEKIITTPVDNKDVNVRLIWNESRNRYDLDVN